MYKVSGAESCLPPIIVLENDTLKATTSIGYCSPNLVQIVSDYLESIMRFKKNYLSHDIVKVWVSFENMCLLRLRDGAEHTHGHGPCYSQLTLSRVRAGDERDDQRSSEERSSECGHGARSWSWICAGCDCATGMPYDVLQKKRMIWKSSWRLPLLFSSKPTAYLFIQLRKTWPTHHRTF